MTTLSTADSITNSTHGHFITTSSIFTLPLKVQHITSEYPIIFDGQLRSMQGEQLHMSILDDVKPFCVNTLRAILFAYHDKLKAELNLLAEQKIIAPITTATE